MHINFLIKRKRFSANTLSGFLLQPNFVALPSMLLVQRNLLIAAELVKNGTYCISQIVTFVRENWVFIRKFPYGLKVVTLIKFT